MKLGTKKLLICIPLGIVFLVSLRIAILCISEFVIDRWQGESFWTLNKLIVTLVISLLLANNSLAALIYFACKKRKA